MGYTTDFYGQFDLNKQLNDELYEFLVKLSDTRRMKRKLGPEYGIDGELFVGGGGFMSQPREGDVIDRSRPPITQPGLWCKWEPTDDRLHIQWNDAEKFYYYIEWLNYIIQRFLKPNGYILNGSVTWSGERDHDTGTIEVTNNNIRVIPNFYDIYKKGLKNPLFNAYATNEGIHNTFEPSIDYSVNHDTNEVTVFIFSDFSYLDLENIIRLWIEKYYGVYNGRNVYKYKGKTDEEEQEIFDHVASQIIIEQMSKDNFFEFFKGDDNFHKNDDSTGTIKFNINKHMIME